LPSFVFYFIFILSLNNHLDPFYRDRFYLGPFLPGPFFSGPFLPGPFLPGPFLPAPVSTSTIATLHARPLLSHFFVNLYTIAFVKSFAAVLLLYMSICKTTVYNNARLSG